MLLKYMTLRHYQGTVIKVHYSHKTKSPAIAEGPRDAGVPVEIW